MDDTAGSGVSAPILPATVRVALVHDWLTGMRGGEKCLEVFCELFPDADIFTLLRIPGATSETIESHRIHTSFIQQLPGAASKYRWALPLFPRAIESFDLDSYDLVLTSSHSVAKSVRAAPAALSVCYCYTPMRYIWDRFDDYFGDKPTLYRWAVDRVAARLRRWDRRTAGRTDLWLAISTIVKQRIHDFYGVDRERIEIVFPPVDTAVFRPGAADPPAGLTTGGYDLVVSALVPYKRIDLAVAAAIAAGRQLVVIGDGPERARLQRLAAATRGAGSVRFVGARPTHELPAFYTHARCFVFPGLEDFGITPLESTACGRPVVAYAAGGALDTIREDLNGIFFTEQTVAGLGDALCDSRLAGPWDSAAMAAHASAFSRDVFRGRIARRVASAWRGHERGEAHV